MSLYQEKERVLVQSQMVDKSLRKGYCLGVAYLTLVRIHSTLRGKLRTLLLFGFFFPLCSPNPHIHTGTLEAVHGSSSLHFFIHSAFNATSVCVLVAQSCPTLCDPMDCSPPGSFVHEISKVRILEWVAISSSKGSSPPRDRTSVCFLHCRWVLCH